MSRQQGPLASAPTKPTLVCGGCGYQARDDNDLAAHLLRSGAYRDGKRGQIRLMPDQPHAEPRGENDGNNNDGPTNDMPPLPANGLPQLLRNSARHLRDWRLAGEDDAGVPRVFRHNIAGRKEGSSIRAWLVLANLGVLGFLTSVVLLSFGPAVATMLLAGPLAPWAGLLTWGWQHGEVSLPVALALVLVPALPWTRRALGRGIARGLELMGAMMVWLLIAVVLLGFGAWLVGFIWIWIVPGLK